ncbi:Transforming protein Ski [Chionoecetes opilio]|uniref:Transforming protein Ski n=1 Tax=Chionoecetes opilio TaxID=41210 RepID=A0A8J5CZN2_CHIOP|nr:Transforming protein Ski [Chionoecetes opilio]
MSSLHGPGPNCYLNDTGRMGLSKKLADCDDDLPSIKQLDATTKLELYRGLSFKKALLYEVDSLNKSKAEIGSRRCINTECRRLPVSCPPTSHTPTAAALAGQHPTLADSKATPVEVTTTTTTANLLRNSASNTATTCNSTNITTSASDSIIDVEESWVEPGVFLAPAPFPPQPWPVLTAADKGSPGAGLVRETLLDGEPITCFNVGGEMRLCLPQIMNTVLRDFSLSQINAVCEELRIYLDGCNEAQLDALRVAGVLPDIAPSCGLITNTDAQRLTQALLYAHPTRAPVLDPSKPQDHPKLRVYHTCFGKCKGLVWDDLYTGPNAACIECEECHGLLPPARFVCHAHRSLENQTIHWGFDAEQWRTYLLLAKDQQLLPLEKAEAQLKAFKSKFDPVCANYKRKQVL